MVGVFVGSTRPLLDDTRGRRIQSVRVNPTISATMSNPK